MNSRSPISTWSSRGIRAVIAITVLLSAIAQSSEATPPGISFGENLIKDVVVVTEQGSKNITSAWTKKQTGVFTQRIDLSILADSIDKGSGLKYIFSGCVGANKDDSLKAIFLADNDAAIGVAAILADEPGADSGKLKEKSVSGTIPQGTRTILIEAKVAVDDTTSANPMLVLAPNVASKPTK